MPQPANLAGTHIKVEPKLEVEPVIKEEADESKNISTTSRKMSQQPNVRIKSEQEAEVKPVIKEEVDEDKAESEKKIQDLLKRQRFQLLLREGEKAFFVIIKLPQWNKKEIVGKVGLTVPWDYVCNFIQAAEGIPRGVQSHIFNGRQIKTQDTAQSLGFATDDTKGEAEAFNLVFILRSGAICDGCQADCSACGWTMPKVSREDMDKFAFGDRTYRDHFGSYGRGNENNRDEHWTWPKEKDCTKEEWTELMARVERNRAESDERAQKRKRSDS